MIACAAEKSQEIAVFDTISDKQTDLRCTSTVASLKWSPSGEYLLASMQYVALVPFDLCFCTTHHNTLLTCSRKGGAMMWETATWHNEMWDISAEVKFRSTRVVCKRIRSTRSLSGENVGECVVPGQSLSSRLSSRQHYAVSIHLPRCATYHRSVISFFCMFPSMTKGLT